MEFIESCIERILTHYEILSKESLHQTQALQFLFDVKFVTTLCVPRENSHLMGKSQSLCDGFRAKVDPFDLDVFYGYLQGNVQKCIFQSQVIKKNYPCNFLIIFYVIYLRCCWAA